MKLRDLIEISSGNLRRMKLRTFLTVAGVVIAISSFVAMLSFAAGIQKNVTDEFNQLGLLSTMQVYPLRKADETDSVTVKPLDDSAVVRLSQLNGVRLAYPYDHFPIKAQFNDSVISCDAQALPLAAAGTKLFSRVKSGGTFASDSAAEVIVAESFLKDAGLESSDSVVGREIVISVEASSVDSALMFVLHKGGRDALERVRKLNFDSLKQDNFLRNFVSTEAGHAMKLFLDGFMNARITISDTLKIVGVLKTPGGHSRAAPILVPVKTARKFTSSGFTGDPTQLFASLSSGSLFTAAEDANRKDYPRVTLDLDPNAPYRPIKDSVEAMGYRTFSYIEEFEQMRRSFRYIKMALSAIGLIALITAALGIVNTMVMSIIERRREIGILKSLGADEREIKLLFLVESGVIGSIGAVFGILIGWLITRIASMVVQSIMVKEGIDTMDLFDLPLWLIITAYLFGLIVSLVAGYYPASRAARVDPVEALRTD